MIGENRDEDLSIYPAFKRMIVQPHSQGRSILGHGDLTLGAETVDAEFDHVAGF